ncbi:hypothetical protein FHT22_002448 [Pedobacter sp. SG918]|nr:hypothetical protein [Pedobacter sp. SG918]
MSKTEKNVLYFSLAQWLLSTDYKRTVVIPVQVGILKQYVNLAKALRFPIKLGMTTHEDTLFDLVIEKNIYFRSLSNIRSTI